MQKYPNGAQFTYINDPTHQLEIISYSAATNTYRIKWVAGKYKGQSDTISESFLLHVCTMHNQMHPPTLLIRASVGDTVIIDKANNSGIPVGQEFVIEDYNINIDRIVLKDQTSIYGQTLVVDAHWVNTNCSIKLKLSYRISHPTNSQMSGNKIPMPGLSPDQPTGGVIAKVSPMCAHEWKDYFGLNERYNYCTKCNKKQAET